MSAKYYTQFILTDAQYRGGNEFSGVVELSQPMDMNTDARDIEAVLARNFDLRQNAVKLVSWSRFQPGASCGPGFGRDFFCATMPALSFTPGYF